MTRQEFHTNYQDTYEYHGNTSIELIRKEAHSIKGGSANLTAYDLSSISFELENIGRSGALEEGVMVLEKLENEFQRLEAFAGGMQFDSDNR